MFAANFASQGARGEVFGGPSRALGYALSAALRRDPSGLQGLAPSAPRDEPNARAATGSCECYDAVVERDGRAVNEVRCARGLSSHLPRTVIEFPFLLLATSAARRLSLKSMESW